ncbi:uncharacterized protein At5g39570 [Lotus japonicus]|uniref:uncharacterized protein At5g39570 n=1 Tax=Lotus japonicus TaxID=34305 RepID=UPI00258F9601|nr:uncharacterized protein At5g39570 [Lotus japonicus]
MAYYYNSANSGSEYGEYNFNSYAVNYDYAPQVPPFMNYNSHEYNQVNQPYYGYDQSLCFAPNYYPDQCYQRVSYSATNFSEPKSLVYDPNYGMSQLVISYSKLEFNEPEFEEYDPTPYGGGYDIVETYGKPLPPSDKICHPRSDGPSSNSIIPLDTVPAVSIVPLPTVKEGIDEKAIIPQNGTAGQMLEDKPQSQDIISTDQPKEVENNRHVTFDLKADEGEEDSEESDDEDDYSSESGNGYSGVQYDEHEKQVPLQYPSGYGLETVDICESLFGNWPCLSRMKREQQQALGGNNCQDNMWQGTADYLFGNPYPYGGRGEDGSSYGGNLVYGYERHYPSQAQCWQIDYTDKSW